MRLPHPQRGLAAALVVLLMVLFMVGAMAAYLLVRVSDETGDRSDTTTSLAAAQAALEAYAAAGGRLPCPANPALDLGEEVLPAVGAATCSFPEGTLPWKTIGLPRDDAYDAWGRKISYRVYTGNAGSLTQPGGASMVECDTFELSPAAATANLGSAGRLCTPNADVYQRATPPANFLAGKGLTLDDSGTARADVAYVLVSHGSTGLGGYTVSGARLDLPTGDERNNTRETGPFTIKAFSAADVAATNAQHFDDLLAYRTVSELVRRASRSARNWPDTVAVFSEANLEAILGRDITAGTGVGESRIDLGGVTVSGMQADANAVEITFDVVGGVGGIGVDNGTSTHLESGVDELLRFEFTRDSAKLGITLNHFGGYFTASADFPGFEVYLEQVTLRFYHDDMLVATVAKFGCAFDGGLGSFQTIVPGVEFDRVDVAASPSVNLFPPPPGGISTFLVSEIKACLASDATCTPSLHTPANECT